MIDQGSDLLALGSRRAKAVSRFRFMWLLWPPQRHRPLRPQHRRLNRDHHRLTCHRPWGDLLSDQLLDDLKVWSDSWDFTIVQEDEEDVPEEVLEERGRALAIRVQNELGTDGCEVLYFQDGQAHRVHPPGSWPDDTWERDLLGHAPPDLRKLPEEDA